MTNPILVEVYRGEVLESFHRGVICIVNENDEVVFSMGDVQQLCFPRSAMKFFQQIPLLTSGAVEHFGFTQKEIAIFCGSHNGEPEHVETVQSILSKIGLTADDLLCGAQIPILKEDANYLIKNDLQPKLTGALTRTAIRTGAQILEKAAGSSGGSGGDAAGQAVNVLKSLFGPAPK